MASGEKLVQKPETITGGCVCESVRYVVTFPPDHDFAHSVSCPLADLFKHQRLRDVCSPQHASASSAAKTRAPSSSAPTSCPSPPSRSRPARRSPSTRPRRTASAASAAPAAAFSSGSATTATTPVSPSGALTRRCWKRTGRC